jgi:hypothetical protein
VLHRGRAVSRRCEADAKQAFNLRSRPVDQRRPFDRALLSSRVWPLTPPACASSEETVVPGPYSGRTRHIHVKAHPEGGALLTTQLYFPGEAQNETDAIFDPRLLMEVRAAGAGRRARFDFVLEA